MPKALQLHTHLYRECLSQAEQERVHIEIRVFAEAVGLGMVLVVQMIPPASR